MDMEALFAGLMNGDGEIEREREEVEVDPGIEKWLPAYFENGSGTDVENRKDSKAGVEVEVKDLDSVEEGQHRVVDPTGGGNGFLGGLAIALARGKSLEEAAAWGSVAASFAIEQVGMPIPGKDEEERETWNGVVVQERLEEFKKRVGMEG